MMCVGVCVLTAATVPQIAQGLKTLTCAQGKAARFEAVIHGQPPPQITWCDIDSLNLILSYFVFFPVFCSQLKRFIYCTVAGHQRVSELTLSASGVLLFSY